MSASEKLRALDGAMTPGPWYEGRTWRYDDPHFPEITPDEANTRRDKLGKRYCRACQRERWHERKR